MEYYIDAFKKYADFSGRARRKEYWMFTLINLVVCIAAGAADVATGLGFIYMVYSLVALVPSISITARRLHDTGRSGWWQLIAIVPLVGLIVLLVFLVSDGHDENDYGLNPKALAA